MRKFVDYKNNVVNEGEWYTLKCIKRESQFVYVEKMFLDKQNIDWLLKHKVLKEIVEEWTEEGLKKEIFDVLYKKNKNYQNLLSEVHKINEWSAYQLLLKTAAVILDKKYTDHISKAKEIYVFSPSDGNIHGLAGDKNLQYHLFPAFRTHEEALLAVKCVMNIIDDFIRTK